MNFNSIDELREWLTAVHINTATWGQDGAKTVADLWQEIVAGETMLQAEPPQRLVQLVEMVIRRGDHILVEGAQELADGQIRKRGILPAEKMKVGEEVETAVLRGLREELGVPANAAILHHDTYQQRQRRQQSPSYPGLPTLYTVHSLAVTIPILPDSDFWRDNVAYGQGDPVKRHHWVWRLESDI